MALEAKALARPIAVDLFAGAGGLSLGFEQGGFDVVAAVEYDPVHALTHAYNFPLGTVLCRDVSKLTGDDIREAAQRGFEGMYPGHIWPGTIDAIIGGPPCQGFSSGGKRDASDSRNNLLLEFVRLVLEVRPRSFCLENVAGLLEAKFDEVRQLAFDRLASAGYVLDGTNHVRNSLQHGVPQSRRRVIVLGVLNSVAASWPGANEATVSVGEAFQGLPSVGKYDTTSAAGDVVLDEGDLVRRSRAESAYAKRLNGVEIAEDDLSWRRDWSFSRLSGLKPTVHTRETIARFSRTAQGTVEPKSRLYRLPVAGPARTLRAGSGTERGSHTSPRPIHPLEHRVITVREAARLHGYPDWFRFHVTNWHGHRQIGNSVPPPLARVAAQSLRTALSLPAVPPNRQISLGDASWLTLSHGAAATLLGANAGETPRARVRQGVRQKQSVITLTSDHGAAVGAPFVLETCDA
jgi:DNA (cytosine-5)-methyltransferase 1